MWTQDRGDTTKSAVASIVLGLALGALGRWLPLARRIGEAWVGAVCFAAAVYLLVTGTIDVLGWPVALNAITAAGAAMAASGVLAVVGRGWPGRCFGCAHGQKMAHENESINGLVAARVAVLSGC